ncbi:MAG TPA: hypothetical protein DC042_03400 [Bacteroidales bacterium]|nr:hypothetical protein [Bacteroidales bacterium]
MKKINRIIGIGLLVLLTGCDPTGGIEGNDEIIIPPDTGTLEFRFILPEYKIPKDKVHRISLGFAWSADSLYKSLFFRKVNVSDLQEVYTVYLLPDEYYYDAVITCSCEGDTCLNGGFPGGRFGMKHNFNKFFIEKQKSLVIETHFQ